MVGLVGRSSFLLDCRLGQYSRRCSVVSAGLSQWRQCGWCSGLILLRCWFVLVCWVLNWKIRLWSCLSSSFMASCGLGCAISLNITRPVDPHAHLFSQSSFSLFFRICLMGFFCARGDFLWFCGSYFGEFVCFFISTNVAVSWNPLECNMNGMGSDQVAYP